MWGLLIYIHHTMAYTDSSFYFLGKTKSVMDPRITIVPVSPTNRNQMGT